ncbi:MAG: ribulose-phosphate 3-epimerase [Streptosporangiales bacterium]|nr:ribulose-phosphate 3-epimerase [Streptosporangiales bacterium]
MTDAQLVKAITKPAIVASALPANFARLGEDCRALEKAGVDRIQWDLMDGRFVPNLTFGPGTVAAARAETDLPFEAHLMTLEPEAYAASLADAGCELMIVHAEACPHLHRTLAAIRDAGLRAGVALNPATPLDAVAHVLDLTGLILVMTVNPGFGGQRYLASMEPKITAARRLADTAPHPVEVEVDGGIGPATAGRAAAAGADVLVAGSALFHHPGGPAAAVTALRSAAEKGRP